MNTGKLRRIRSVVILILDVITIIAIFSILFFQRLERFPDYRSADLWIIIATFIVTLFFSGTYFKERNSTLPALPIRTFFVCLIGGAICILWVYLLGPNKFNDYFGRGVLPFGTLILGVITTLNRFVINRVYHLQEKGTSLLYLGYSKSGQSFLEELKNNAEIHSITVASTFPVDSTFDRLTIENLDNYNQLLKQSWNGIIIDPEYQPNTNQTSALVALRLTGMPVLSLADYYEKSWFMIPVNHIAEDWFLRSQGFSMLGNPIFLRIKRLIDVVLSGLGLLISIPIIALCAFFIRLSSKGPIFFRQTRIGIEGKEFNIVKLRTMITDAEVNGAQWAKKDDPRITSVGNFLRKSRLDELPQFWNVLKGEMSFVGPRPERPEFTKDLSEQIPYYDLRHTVKPGITGWAQVIFPYGASVDDAMKKLQYELYYIKHQSLLLDLNIMIRTIFTVFQRAGR